MLFVKVKQHMLREEWPALKFALKYQHWSANLENSTSNQEFIEEVARLRKLAITTGKTCFDYNYYRKTYMEDLGNLTDSALLEHFIVHGAKEGRTYQFRCRHSDTVRRGRAKGAADKEAPL